MKLLIITGSCSHLSAQRALAQGLDEVYPKGYMCMHTHFLHLEAMMKQGLSSRAVIVTLAADAVSLRAHEQPARSQAVIVASLEDPVSLRARDR